MASTLLRSAVHVRQAGSASEARRAALGWLPHVILLDVRLAGENGYATARQIRESWPSARQLPRIIMISADPPKDSSARAKAAAGDEFLLKPITAEQLEDAVLGANRPSRPAAANDTPSAGELQCLFRAELANRLEALDLSLARPDLPAAQGILHQLIASSALCQQHRLERDLRGLYGACRGPIEASALARNYFALLASARDYLGEP
jgi:CheY-like chemotaxis protein